MDQTVETILIVSVILGTTVFTVAGVWIILILKELRGLTKKLHLLMESAESTVVSINRSASMLPEIVNDLKDSAKSWSILKQGIGMLIAVAQKYQQQEVKKERKKTETVNKINNPNTNSKIKKFFSRSK
jgi:biopolymer transport protein ExbB/TolQ